MEEIKFKANGLQSEWWGYDDYFCMSPNKGTKILLPYESEPPHGDSYHRLIINDKTIRGYIWSAHFLWSDCGNYFTCDWLEGMGGHRNIKTGGWVLTQVLRATIVVEPKVLSYRIILKPQRNDLHKLIKEEEYQKLWAILLDEDEWEKFH